MMRASVILRLVALFAASFLVTIARGLESVSADAQPLGANIERVMAAYDLLGAPLPEALQVPLRKTAQARDARAMQELLDPLVLLSVHVNPEARVKVARGPVKEELQQVGYRWLDRKANTVKATLFSFIIAQHDQILRWLE
ncbi:MAG: hypothetical protein ABI318_17055, partial [Chthoniobacteraceae bacterium]